MKVRPKTLKGTVLLMLVIAAAVVAVCVISGTSIRSAARIGYVGSERRSSWSGKYVSLDGTMRKKLHPKSDCLHIEVETRSGSLSIEIKDGLGKVIFDEDNIGTESFDIPVSGTVSIRLEADKHQGSFQIGSVSATDR